MTYQYLAADLTSRTVLEELPLTGVSAGLKLNKPGPFRAKLELNKHPPLLQSAYMAATIPGRTVVYVIRDGALMGGWLIRKRGGGMNTIDLVGESLVGWLADVVAWGGTEDWARYRDMDQIFVAWDLVRHAFLEDPHPFIELTLPAYSGRLVTAGYDEWDNKPLLEVITDLAEDRDGFDFDISPEFDTDGNIHNVFRAYYPKRGNDHTLDLEWAEGPGQEVLSVDWPEDATTMATEVIVTGSGEGDSRVTARAFNGELTLSGWPQKVLVESFSDIDDHAALQGLADGAADAAEGPRVVPKLTVSADTDPPLGSYWPGDGVRFRATSPRFPRRLNGGPGLDVHMRITELMLTPPVHGFEQVSLSLADIVTSNSRPVGLAATSGEGSGDEQSSG